MKNLGRENNNDYWNLTMSLKDVLKVFSQESFQITFNWWNYIWFHSKFCKKSVCIIPIMRNIYCTCFCHICSTFIIKFTEATSANICRFQVYNSKIHMYTALYVRHSKLNFLPLSYICSPLTWSTFSTLLLFPLVTT